MTRIRITLAVVGAVLAVGTLAAPAQAMRPLPPPPTASYRWVQVSSLGACSWYPRWTGQYYTEGRIWPTVYCQLRR